jgi:hypothetical protein
MSVERTRIETSVRIPTGVLICGNDWPGVFIRGDEAITMATEIRAARQAIKEGRRPTDQRIGCLEALLDMLESCDARKMDLIA